MTHQSCSNSLDEVVPGGSSCSSSTTSREVYSLPLGHNGDVYLSQEEQNLVGICGGLAAETGAQTIVVGSPGTRVGNEVLVTVEGNANFTINHVGSSGQPLGDGAQKNDYAAAQKSEQKQHHRFRYVFLPTTVVALLLLSTVSLVIFRKSLFPRVVVFPPTNPETNQYILGHPVYSRANWGALEEKEPLPSIPLPTAVVIISHSASKGCSNFTECSNRTQTIQYGFLEGGDRDIGYNFLIGGEGGIYFGRGWDRQNSVRDKSIAIAFIGDFNKDYSTKSAEDAAKALIAEGVNIGKIEPDYKLVGENQTSPLRFYSPGWHLVNVIKKWDHYFSGTML